MAKVGQMENFGYMTGLQQLALANALDRIKAPDQARCRGGSSAKNAGWLSGLLPPQKKTPRAGFLIQQLTQHFALPRLLEWLSA